MAGPSGCGILELRSQLRGDVSSHVVYVVYSDLVSLLVGPLLKRIDYYGVFDAV